MNCQDKSSTTPIAEIQLDPTDWFLATWRDLPPLVRSEPASFDREKSLGKLKKLRASRHGALRDWEEIDVPVSMTSPEANFWLRAMTEGNGYLRASRLVQRLAKVSVDTPLTADAVLTLLRPHGRLLPGKVLHPLAHVLSPLPMLDLLLPPTGQPSPAGHLQAFVDRDLARAFSVAVLPYLSQEERQALRDRLRPEITPDRWSNTWHASPPLAFRLAAQLGLHTELQALVNTWREDVPDPWFTHLDIILGLGDPKLVELHARRLKCRPTSPRHLRAWLAHTGTSALDWIEQTIRGRHPGEVSQYLDALCRVQSPVAAPLLLGLKIAGHGPELVREWMDENVSQTVVGLLPLLSGKGKLSDLVLDYLRRVQQRGLSEVIEQSLPQTTPEIAARVRRLVLDQEDSTPEYLEIDEQATPDWLNVAPIFHDLRDLPGWLAVECLPPLVMHNRRLTRSHILYLIVALRMSKPNSIQDIVKKLKLHVERTFLDPFVWRLFELWKGDGAPVNHSWVMTALGQLGGDGTALKLAPVIREWAAAGEVERAKLGLEVLASIGTRTALMELNGIANQSRTRRLRERAQELGRTRLRERVLTLDELDDLSVPDLGLDGQGGREFDFGPRRFRVRISPNLKPVLHDQTGKNQRELPRPRKDDDPRKADEARQEWSLFRKQLREAVRLQGARLERSLINCRRWSFRAFDECILQHPLLGQLTRSLLWGSYNAARELVQTFRLSEDGTFADVEDRSCTVDRSLPVGLVHPVHLTEEQRGKWSALFGDYEIVPPFQQLGRPVHRLSTDEEETQELQRFPGVKVSDLALLAVLGNSNWVVHWNGIHGRVRYFPGQDVTAAISLSGWSEKNLDYVAFHRGAFGQGVYVSRAQAMKAREVDPVILSEVLADMSRLAARGRQTANV